MKIRGLNYINKSPGAAITGNIVKKITETDPAGFYLDGR
jgi:hypothetical protein